MVFGFCWMKSGVAACVQSISETVTAMYRFGTDGYNSLADCHDGSSDHHPGGLTRRRAASSDRQGVAGSKCSGSTKDECDSTHNSCFYEQLRVALVCTSSCDLKTVSTTVQCPCGLCVPTNRSADCAADNELAHTHTSFSTISGPSRIIASKPGAEAVPSTRNS